MNMPYLIYYFKKYQPEYAPGMTRLEFEKTILYQMLDHHYAYGCGGFLSERSTLKGIFDKIESELFEQKYQSYLNQPEYSIMNVAVFSKEEEAETKKSVEQAEGYDFVRWVEDKNE